MIVKEIEKQLTKDKHSLSVFPLDLSKVAIFDKLNQMILKADKLVVAYLVYVYDVPVSILKFLNKV